MHFGMKCDCDLLMAGWMSENSSSRYLPDYYSSLFSTQITEVILTHLKLLLKLLSSFLHSNCAVRSCEIKHAFQSTALPCVRLCKDAILEYRCSLPYTCPGLLKISLYLCYELNICVILNTIWCIMLQFYVTKLEG